MKTLWQQTVSKIRQSIGIGPLNPIENPANATDSSCDPRQTGKRQAKPLGVLYAAIARMPEQVLDQRQLQNMHKLESCVAAYGGHVTYFTDDSILAEFGDTDSALHCAINIQLAARQWNAALDPERQVRYRMGVHVGQNAAGQSNPDDGIGQWVAEHENLICTDGIVVFDSNPIRFEDCPSRMLMALDGEPAEGRQQTYWIRIDELQFVGKKIAGRVKVSAVTS